METNYLFPLPIPVHIIFCIVGVLFFAMQYYRKKYTYHLLLTFAIPSTLLIYACSSDMAYTILGFEELILFILILVSIALTKKRLAKQEQGTAKLLDESEDNNENNNT